jgi:hypothetical protein
MDEMIIWSISRVIIHISKFWMKLVTSSVCGFITLMGATSLALLEFGKKILGQSKYVHVGAHLMNKLCWEWFFCAYKCILTSVMQVSFLVQQSPSTETYTKNSKTQKPRNSDLLRSNQPHMSWLPYIFRHVYAMCTNTNVKERSITLAILNMVMVVQTCTEHTLLHTLWLFHKCGQEPWWKKISCFSWSWLGVQNHDHEKLYHIC